MSMKNAYSYSPEVAVEDWFLGPPPKRSFGVVADPTCTEAQLVLPSLQQRID